MILAAKIKKSCKMTDMEIRNKKFLVMGLGLHGGGVETARYLAGHGARVVCTDLQSREVLQKSVDKLSGLGIRFVLGRHNAEDFDEADIIVKNPAIPWNSPLLSGRENLETDISLFLKVSHSPVIAVTGSKGKSTVVSALHSILVRHNPDTRIGGNIAVNPLSFVHELTGNEPVVLELSSWQLGDLHSHTLLRPKIACITNLMRDHQNRYSSFSHYERDKTEIFKNSGFEDWTVFPDDEYGRKWAESSGGRSILIGLDQEVNTERKSFAWLDNRGNGYLRMDNEVEELLPSRLQVPGQAFKQNMLFAGVMARLWGCEAGLIRTALAGFQGVPYRMEKFLEADGVSFYDDTTATIPDAAAAGLNALSCPVILIAGGTDKALDFSPFDDVACKPKKILMLSGSATDKWMPRLKKLGASVDGPFDSMDSAVDEALSLTENGDAVLLSPGAASFDMFQHEFRRGDAFKACCRLRTDQRH